MAYLITYLIDVRGIEFNRLLKPSDQADNAYFQEMARRQESDLRDGMLLDDDTWLLVDLTGEWTLCKLPYSHAWLLVESGSSDIPSRIEKWEQKLQSLLPSTEIVRVDDFLLDGWNARYDYLMIRSPRAVEEFIEWLQTQDPRYWRVLTKSRQA